MRDDMRRDLEAKSLQLHARMARERAGQMDSGDILDTLLGLAAEYDEQGSYTIWIPAPIEIECFVDAVLRGETRRGTEIVFRLVRIDWPAETRRCGQKADVEMVRATYSAEEIQ